MCALYFNGLNGASTQRLAHLVAGHSSGGFRRWGFCLETTRVVTTWTELIFGPNPRFVDSASSIVAMRMAAPSIVAMRMAAQRQRKLGQGSAAGGPSSA